LGRLIGAVDPQGRITVYEYDEVGNLLAVRRPEPQGAVAITYVNPGIGPSGTSVEIFGAAFSAVPTANQVRFNGTPASVLTASTTRLVTQVPAAATTGPIAVTTPLGSAVSPSAFIVPHITISPTQISIITGKQRQFTATITESGDARMTWGVNGTLGGDATVGRITLDGLYTAPAEDAQFPATVQVQATSVAFATLSAQATVAIFPPPPSAVVARPIDIRVVRPGSGDPGGLASNLTVATPPWISLVRPGTGDPGGLGLNLTVARPPFLSLVRPGTGDPGGLGLNLTMARPPFLSLVRPGTGDPGGLGLNLSLARPPFISLVLPGTGEAGGLSSNITVARPPDIQVERP
jgi:YD repeat-containing protein